MISNEIKNKIKSLFNVIWFVCLPLCWILGSNLIRRNIQILKSGLEVASSNPKISLYVIDTMKNQINSINGFMVFVEGCSEFYIPLAITLIVGIIFSASFTYDKNTGFGNYILTRTNFKKYYVSKIVSIFVTSFVYIFVTLLLILFSSLIIYSAKTPTQTFNFSMIVENSLPKLFFSHHWIACFFLIFTLSLFGGIYALLGMGVSLFTSNRFAISISPLVIYILCTLIPQLFSIQSPISKYIAWIFPQYFTGIFINNDFWYTKLPVAAVYCIHLVVIVIPTAILLYMLYTKNQKQYIK